MALSRVIDITAATASDDKTVEGQDEDDIQEIVNLITELNQHQDLTVKLSNQAKICKIFSNGKPTSSTSLMKKKLDANL